MTLKFKITNIDCIACVKLSQEVLEKIPGVSNVRIDAKSGEVEVESNIELAWNDIIRELGSVGKKVEK